MMTQEKIDRINYLARKSREQELTDAEKAEQARLREEYILEWRASMTGILDNTYIQRQDGTKEKLQRNGDKKNG